MSNPLILRLDGCIIPKARPRVAGHAFLPKSYRDWRNMALASLLAQTDQRELSGVIVNAFLIGKHRQSADSDNLIGSILDALVSAKILANDNLKHCKGSSCIFHESKEAPYSLITITTLTTEENDHVRQTINVLSQIHSSQKSEKSNEQKPQS